MMLLCALATGMALATEREFKGKVIRTVETTRAGTAEILCNDPGEWTFDVKASTDAGRDVVTVRLSAPRPVRPPQFGVYFLVSGAGVQNVWTTCFDRLEYHLWPKLWWGGSSTYQSALAYNSPIAVGFNSTEAAPVALACSEAMRFVKFGLYADDRTCEIAGRCEFFTGPSPDLQEYEVSVMLDRRGLFYGDVVREATDWIMRRNGIVLQPVPEAAYDPLYSTWYAYLQDVHADELEEEARQAASLGMKTMILDDGWQKEDSKTFYSAVGDWMPVKSRFPDMKAHVGKVHAAGLKYMLWLAAAKGGAATKVWPRFPNQRLSVSGKPGEGQVGTLDPRFPDVREYLITTYERVIGEWGFDGVKLDFIDSFSQPSKADDPAEKDGFSGRDYRVVQEATDRLMKDVYARLRKINPNVLIEFRQSYMGPYVLQYGNMMRAADCPADPCANRRRTFILRLTSGNVAVHSDMLVWNRDETLEGAALPILNAIYSTIQYSMILKTINPAHREVIRHWLGFSQRHREALLRGSFRPHHPECGYPWAESESASERIVTTYSQGNLIPTGAADKPVIVINATGAPGVVLDAPADGRAEFFDVVGRPAGSAPVAKGVARLAIPASGYARIQWTSSSGTPGAMVFHRPQEG